MTEQEYSDCTNLTRLRDAMRILCDLHFAETSKHWAQRRIAIHALNKILADLEAVVTTEESS